MNRFLGCVFSGLFTILLLHQEQTPRVEQQQLNAVHRAEVKNTVGQLIQSTSTSDPPWAAYLIGEYVLNEFAPALIEFLNPNQFDTEGETEFVYRAVLDSLIRLRVSVPSDSLMQLIQEPKRDAVVVAPGAHPVFYERRVIEAGVTNQRGMSVSDHSVQRDRYCLEYLAALLGQGASELELRERHSKSINWSGIQRYKIDVISLRELVAGNFERLKKQCVERNLLSESEAEALRPNLIITVRDLRENKTPQLPEITGVEKKH